MAMRWNQHNLHGTKLASSLKYRLPAIATAAISQASAIRKGLIMSRNW